MAMDFEEFKQGLIELEAKGKQLEELEFSVPELANSVHLVNKAFPVVAEAKVLQLLSDYIGVSVHDVRENSRR